MRLWSRIKRTFRGDPESAAIDEELRFHIAMDVAAGCERREARRRLGNPDRIADDTRAVRIVPWLDALLRDVGESLRRFSQSSVLALAVILSLALGIGMNAAIFSLIDAAVLKPLPVEDPGSLVHVDWIGDSALLAAVENFNGMRLRTLADGKFSGSMVPVDFYRRLSREQTGVAALLGMSTPDLVMTSLGPPAAESSRIQYVSSNFFQGLGLVPLLGRTFDAADDRTGTPPVVVISRRCWMSRLGGSADAIGRDVRIDGRLARIVGVAPQGFFGTTPGIWTDFYAPLAARDVLDPRNEGDAAWTDDRNWWVHEVARLHATVPEGAAIDRLERSLRALASEIMPATSDGADLRLAASPASHGFDTLAKNDEDALLVLQLLVGVLILIVSANIANLLLSSVVGQQHACSVRRALGASRFRLLQRSFVESGLLALCGGLAGLLLGYVLAHAVHALFQSGRDGSRVFALGIDLRLVGYVGALTLSTTLLFGTAPALRTARAVPSDALKGKSRTVTAGSLRLPRTLVSIQFALCLVATIAAGLLGRTLQNLTRVDIGVDAPGLTYVTIDPRNAGYTPERIGAYVEAARAALRALPQVTAASVLQYPALGGHADLRPASVPGRSTSSEGPFDMTDAVFTQGIDETTLRTLGIALLAGNSELYRPAGSGLTPVVVDERFVRHFFGGGTALGRRIQLGADGSDRYEIVGIAAAARWGGLRGDDRPVVYLPFLPAFWNAPIELAIRAEPGIAGLAADVRRALATVDPAVEVTDMQTQAALFDQELRTERLLAFISAAFGVCAIVIAGVGLGGMLFYAVTRRTNEIGVRMALGAGRTDVVRMVLRDSYRMLAIGIVIGLPIAYGLGRLLEFALFDLGALDPMTTAGSLAVLLLVAFTASWLPARHAARIDPLDALREE